MRGGEGAPPAADRAATTATIIGACVMQGLDTPIVNVCLPHIQGSMSAAQDQISWVLTSYIVNSCAFWADPWGVTVIKVRPA